MNNFGYVYTTYFKKYIQNIKNGSLCIIHICILNKNAIGTTGRLEKYQLRHGCS